MMFKNFTERQRLILELETIINDLKLGGWDCKEYNCTKLRRFNQTGTKVTGMKYELNIELEPSSPVLEDCVNKRIEKGAICPYHIENNLCVAPIGVRDACVKYEERLKQ